MIYIYLDCDKEFRKKAKYVFNLYFNCLRIKAVKFIHSISHNSYSNGLLIYYGSKTIQIPDDQCFIHISDGNYNQQLKTVVQLKVEFMQKVSSPSRFDLLHDKIPFLFKKNLPSMRNKWYKTLNSNDILISSNNYKINCSVDIIASAFYILSLENERQSFQKDSFNRFNQSYSIIGDEIYQKPFIEYYIHLLFAFIREMSKTKGIKTPQNQLWPNQHRFALVLSHDIDRVRTVTWTKIKRKLKEKRNGSDIKFTYSVLSEIYQYIRRNRGWAVDFEYICQMEYQYQAHSTFFIASKQRVHEDPKYRINSKSLKNGIKSIQKNKNEVALHGSIESAGNDNFLIEEKQILENHSDMIIYGIRNHYLSFNENRTFNSIEKSHFEYDSTLGFAEKCGYRCGLSLPFKPYDINKSQPHKFWELPLILMDTVLLLESKMSLSSDDVWPIIEEHLQEAYQNGSCLSLNWHGCNINSIDLTGYSRIYQKILQWAYKNNGWICSFHELIQWWSKHEIQN